MAKLDSPDPAVSRRLNSTLTFRGAPRAITAALCSGDRLVFTLEEYGNVGSLGLVELFWQAMRSNPARQKHPLQPRTCKGSAPKKPGRKSNQFYASRYGVSTGTIAHWRRSGAPLNDPDRMGDYIFTIRLRSSGRGRRKEVLA